MPSHPAVTLTQPIEASIERGHPWVYADAVSHRGLDVAAGDVVDVLGRDRSFVGRGIIDPDSPLRVRIWTRDPTVQIDEALRTRRIKLARRRRATLGPDTTGVRVLHGEGDLFPGLVCDRYGAVGVLRPDGLAAERWMPQAQEILARHYPITDWVVRRGNVHVGPGRPRAEWLGTAPDSNLVEFLEHGVTYVCDVIDGQKTGFFLDQRANRQRVAALAPGRRVLNLFGYTGGFSLAAAMQGAARTTTVDLAAPAIEMAQENFRRNGLAPQAHEFIAADVFDYLEALPPGAAPFEILVCDPPSFAHRKKDVSRARDAYIRLFSQVLERAASGAMVVLASCSSHIGRDAFLDIVSRAALAAHVDVVLTGVYGADIDHPVLPGFLQGDYLQCVFGMVSRDD